MKKRVVQALIASIAMSSLLVTPIFAAPQDTVDELEAQKSEAQAQAASVRSELTSLLVEYQALQQDMADQEVRITEANQELETAQAEEAKQYEDMKRRIKYMYEEGDTSFIEAIVSAKSFTELVNKSEYVQKVHNYDRTKLQEYVETKAQVATLKDELESQQAEMADMSVEMEAQQTNLQTTLDVMREQIADFDTQLESARAEAEAELARAEAEVAQVVAAQPAAQSSSSASAQANAGQQATGGQTAKAESNTGAAAANTANQQASAATSTEQQASATSQPAASTPAATTTQPAASSSSGSSSKSSGSTSTSSKPSNASRGQQIASRGQNYIGNPYVYGGNSLTNGIDCSGFVQQIHAQFGISTPRDSTSLRYGGKAVNYEDMLPGDVICYSGHVAIYIGGNSIVHASNSAPYPKGGIKISSPVNYRTVLAVRRYW